MYAYLWKKAPKIVLNVPQKQKARQELIIFVSYQKNFMRIATLIALMLLCIAGFTQQRAQPQPQAQETLNRAELEKQRQSIMESIRQIEQELEATKQNKNATMSQLRDLRNKLAERQKLIGNINQEVAQINNNIQSSNQTVAQLRENLSTLKIHYAQSLRYAYQNRSSYDMLAFLFSSKNFNEAMRRVKYLKKYRDYRVQQVEQIKVTQGQIEHQIGILNSEKSQKDILLQAQEKEKQVIQKETNETDQVVQQLKSKEKDILAQIERNRKKQKQMDKAISDIIRREIEAARKKAEEEERRRQEAIARNNPSTPSKIVTNNNAANNNPRTTNNGARPAPRSNSEVIAETENRPSSKYTSHKGGSDYGLSLTPEVEAISSNFEANRGRLPWPVSKGYISDHFGTHPHPVEQHVMIENSGVDIRTSAGAEARAVFDGTVSKIFKIFGTDWNVLINHGRYMTLYAHLSSVNVREGQSVHTKQAIGSVGTNDEGENVINFQIWKVVGKGSVKIDPESWIAR